MNLLDLRIRILAACVLIALVLCYLATERKPISCEICDCYVSQYSPNPKFLDQ